MLGVISIFKNINESNITERLGKLELSVTKEIGNFKNDLSRNMNKDFQELNEQITTLVNETNIEVIEENILKIAKELGSKIQSKLNCDGFTLVQNNGIAQEVKHFHLHVIPKYNKKVKLSIEEVYKKMVN